MGKLTTLQKCRHFAELTPAELAWLSTVIESVELKAGDYLFREGEVEDKMYFIATGQVSLESAKLAADSEGATLPEGDSLSDVGLLGSSQHLASAKVRSETATVMALSAEGLQKLCSARPEIGSKILASVGKQLSERVRTVFSA